MKKGKRVAAVVLVMALFAGVFVGTGNAEAKTTTSSIYGSVQSAYGGSFPLSDSNLIKVSRKNVFGDWSTVLGVSAKYFTAYKAAKKSSSKEEYICFICKAASAKAKKKIKSGLAKFVKSETSGNANYHSEKGKKLMKNAKIGSKGKFVYLFILDTEGNKKAVNAFKKSV